MSALTRDSCAVVTVLQFVDTTMCAAQQRIAFLTAMQVCKTREMRLDRGALGLKPSALVAVAGEGPEGRKAPRLNCAAWFGCGSLLGYLHYLALPCLSF